MAGSEPVDRNATVAEVPAGAVEAELTARLTASTRATLVLHPLLAAVCSGLFWAGAWSWDMVVVTGAIVAGTLVRGVCWLRATRLGNAPASRTLLRLGAFAVAASWGVAGLVLRQSPMGQADGLAGMIVAGLIASGVATQNADRRTFTIFSSTMLVSYIGAEWLVSPPATATLVTALVLIFWGTVAVLHTQSHRELVASIEMALRLREAEADTAGKRRYVAALLQSAPVPVMVLDSERRVFHTSATFERLFGVREADLVGVAVSDLGGRARGLETVARIVEQTAPDGEPAEIEVVDADGRGRVLRVAIRSGEGAAAGALAIAVEDVTTLRRAERARSEAERQYREILDSGKDLVWRWDGEGRWRFVNDAAARSIYGLGAKDLIGEHFLDITRPDNARADLDAFARLLNGESLDDYETAHVRADGSTVWLSFSCRPIVDGTGRVTGVQGTARDVTERVQHREALERLIAQDALIRALLNGSPDLIALKDASGTYRGVNHAMERVLGLREGEVIGRADSVVFPEATARRIVETDQQAYWERQSVSFEEWMDLPSVGRRRYHIVKTPQFDAQNRPIGLITIARDVTEIYEARERAEQLAREAEHANRMKSAFLANMSHEIRTPMNGVLGMTEILLDTPLTTEQRQAAETVQTSAEALLALLNDILDLSKIEAGHLELETVAFDLAETVTQAARTLAPTASRKEIDLTVDASGDLPAAVMGDPMRLRQVLVNLIGNAVKFTDRGEVVVSAAVERRQGDRAWLHFSVRDTGCGIGADRLERIFDAFAQADTSTARTHGGTGLGLTISRQIVSRMGGELGVRSRAGEGSEFFFTVPMPEAEGGAGRQTGEAPSLADARVLVVDDNAINRRVMRGVLERASARVDEASDGLEALAKLREAVEASRAYAAVLLDDRIGTGRGVDVLAAMKADPELSPTPALLLSSGSQPAEAQRARRLGVGGLLSKPVNRHDLLMAVWHLVRGEGAAEQEAAVPSPQAAVPLRILIAEDNRVNQQVARALLEKRGHRVDVAENGVAAVALAESHRYDLVFMDLRMPEMDGLEATAKLRATPAMEHLPIVALTAHALQEERDRCLAAGMNDFLSKPFRPIELFAMVERWAPEPGAPCGVEAAANGVGEPVANGNGTGAASVVEKPVDVDGFRAAMREVGVEAVVDSALALFVRDAPGRMKAIGDALARGDCRALDSAAHAFKSGAGSIHAKGLAARLADLEHRAEAGDLDGAQALAGDLNAEYGAVMEQLATEGAPG